MRSPIADSPPSRTNHTAASRSRARAAPIFHPLRWSFPARLVAVMVVVGLAHLAIIAIDLSDDGHLATSTLIIALALPMLLFAFQWWLIVDEVHRRKVAEHQAVEDSERLKTALLAAVSHELRTPLASIKTSITSLLEPGISWDNATREEFLTSIDEDTDRLTRLIANLLDLSRIEGGALKPDRDFYDVAEMLETLLVRLSKTVAGHPIELSTDDDLGEAYFDYVQIGQVLGNLVENAAKFSPPGAVIYVGAERQHDAIDIHVSDHGPGIPNELRTRVFERFFRGEGQAGKPGSGLGLAIAEGLMKAHGGGIRIEDAPWGGADVVVRLPISDSQPGGAPR